MRIVEVERERPLILIITHVVRCVCLEGEIMNTMMVTCDRQTTVTPQHKICITERFHSFSISILLCGTYSEIVSILVRSEQQKTEDRRQKTEEGKREKVVCGGQFSGSPPPFGDFLLPLCT